MIPKKLKKIVLDDFKGVRHCEIPFGEAVTVISGWNGSGKTTIFDAHMWLWADKDSNFKSNPNIRPDDGRECTPTVTETWDVNGMEVTVCKMQKMKKSKPDSNGVSKTAIQNTYTINSVPKTFRDFVADLTERGFDFDHFLVLSHADAFTVQKDTDMRKALFSMATEMTDAQIAAQTAGCEKVAELLITYRMDEIAMTQKATKRKADEQTKKIPGVIEGLEMSKVDDNSADVQRQMDEVNAAIEKLKDDLTRPSETEIELAKVTAELTVAKEKVDQRKNEIYKEIQDSTSELHDAMLKARKKFDSAIEDVSFAESALRRMEREHEDAARRVANLVDAYNRQKTEKPSDSKLAELRKTKAPENLSVCPTCKRVYPESKANELLANFNTDLKNAIATESERYNKAMEQYKAAINQITIDGKAAQKKRDELAEEIESAKQNVEDAKKKLDVATAELTAAQKSVDDASNPAEILANDEQFASRTDHFHLVEGRRDELRDKIREESSEKTDIQRLINSKMGELDDLKAQMARIENNRRINAQIEAQEALLRNFMQSKADAEEILDQIDLVSRRKNELLAESINSHFKVVRWKLFDYLKNGEYTEVTIPEVSDNVHNEWRAIGTTANTALEILGKLDIVSGFQNFYGMYLPVFLDGSERLDTESIKKVEMPCQMIFLRVTNGDLEVQ